MWKLSIELSSIYSLSHRAIKNRLPTHPFTEQSRCLGTEYVESGNIVFKEINIKYSNIHETQFEGPHSMKGQEISRVRPIDSVSSVEWNVQARSFARLIQLIISCR